MRTILCKMRLTALTVGAAMAAVCGIGSRAVGEKPALYLCADSLAKDAAGAKKVYGYIDGKRTECMSEYELLSLYTQAQFEKDSVARRQQRAESEAKAKANTAAAADSMAAQIRAGKKDLDLADLMGVNLENADLSGASFVSADLRRANLAGADLTNANLESAYLRRADLRAAKLAGANLTGAYLAEADLRGAAGLTIESLKAAATLYKAKLDAALMEQAAEEMPEKLKDPSKCWEGNRWSDNDDCNPKHGLENPEKAK